MYFKVEKGTETWNNLNDIWVKIDEYNALAKNLIIELGFEKYGKSNKGIGGGISCIYSKVKPDGYKTVGKKHQNLIFPKSNNKKLLEKFDNLPIMSRDKYNLAIGFKSQFKGLTHHRNYGSERIGDLFIIEISDNCEFTPLSDMIEILNSELKAIKEKHS